MDYKKGLFGCLFLMGISYGFAQNPDRLELSRDEAEDRFLRENILLIAEQLKIDQAKAKTIQAKLWPNPSLEIEEINLGTSTNGLNGLGEFGEGLPPMWGNFGRNQQVSVSIEQLVQTAGKRKKLIALEKMNESMAEAYFRDLLRALKLEFRSSLSQLQFVQFSLDLYSGQLLSLQKLSLAYKNQVALGNVPKGQYVRLRAAELQLSKEITDLEDRRGEFQKELNLLMNLPSHTFLILKEEGFEKDIRQYDEFQLADLFSIASEERPDYRLSVLELKSSELDHHLQFAERIPDLTFKVGYDRGGNFLYNFLGVGVAFDLPVLNRNQGNIKYAKLAVSQAELMQELKLKEVENELVQSWNKLGNSIAFRRRLEPDYERTLDELYLSYVTNFKNRDIDMLAFLDFLEAYQENKTIILENLLAIQLNGEEFNYRLGTDLFN